METEIARNLRAIQTDLNNRLKKLNDEIGTVRADLEAVDRMLQRYEGQTSLPLPVVEDGGGNGSHPLNAIAPDTMTLKEHVLAVLKDGYPQALRARQVRVLVTKHGYTSKAVSFEGAMFAMLSNLNKSGEIEKAGSGLYRYREQEAKE